jgi:hypothetical protein
MKKLRNYILNSIIVVSIVSLGSGCAGLLLADGLASLAGTSGGTSAAAISADANSQNRTRQLLLQLQQQNQNQTAIIAVQQQTLREVANLLEQASSTASDDPEANQNLRTTTKQLAVEIQDLLMKLETAGVPSPTSNPAASFDSTSGQSDGGIAILGNDLDSAKKPAPLQQDSAGDSTIGDRSSDFGIRDN